MNTLQLQFLMSLFAGWVNRSQQDAIEYLEEENQVVCSQNSSATSDELIAGVGFVDQDASRQAYRW